MVQEASGRLAGEVFGACPFRRRPWGGLRTRWRDFILQPAGEKSVCISLLRLMPPATRTQISVRKQNEMKLQIQVIGVSLEPFVQKEIKCKIKLKLNLKLCKTLMM